MLIEKELKNDKITDEREKMLLNILYTSSWAMNRINTLLKPNGITMQQFNVLRILRGHHPEPATLELIQERMIDKMSNTTRLVDKLIQKNLVIRSVCASNRRKVDIHITEAGFQCLIDAEVSHQQWVDLLKTITPEQASVVNKILSQVRD